MPENGACVDLELLSKRFSVRFLGQTKRSRVLMFNYHAAETRGNGHKIIYYLRLALASDFTRCSAPISRSVMLYSL